MFGTVVSLPSCVKCKYLHHSPSPSVSFLPTVSPADSYPFLSFSLPPQTCRQQLHCLLTSPDIWGSFLLLLLAHSDTNSNGEAIFLTHYASGFNSSLVYWFRTANTCSSTGQVDTGGERVNIMKQYLEERELKSRMDETERSKYCAALDSLDIKRRWNQKTFLPKCPVIIQTH